MLRFVTEIGRYLRDSAKAAASGWNRFFFTPADPTVLGAIRLVAGLLGVWSLAVYGLDLRGFLSDDGWADRHTVTIMRPEGSDWVWSFWSVVPDSWLGLVWGLSLAIMLMSSLGLFSRTTTALAWIILVSTSRRATPFLFGFDQILSTLYLYLAVTGASGQAVSLDRLWARWRSAKRLLAPPRLEPIREWPVPSGAPRPTVSANLSLRLMQIHVCLIYGMSGMAKLLGPAWWMGIAVWPTWTDREFAVFDLMWLAAYPGFINFATHVTIAIELAYPFLIWNRWLRPLILGSLVFLHLGIGVTLGLLEFAVAMLALNAAFVDGRWLRSMAAPNGQAKLLYDGACPICRRSMAAVTALDPDRVVEPIDLNSMDLAKVHPDLSREACLKAMHLVRADGKVFAGYDAAVRLASLMPFTWAVSWLGRIPGMAIPGRWIYNRIAGSRAREFCSDETCSIQRPSSEPNR